MHQMLLSKFAQTKDFLQHNLLAEKLEQQLRVSQLVDQVAADLVGGKESYTVEQ